MNEENQIKVDDSMQADLLALEAAASDGDKMSASVPGEKAVPEPVNIEREVMGLLEIALALTIPMFPSLEKIYTADAKQAIGASVAALCKKRGWLKEGIAGEYQEEVACLIVVGPIALATVTGIKADIAAKKKETAAKIEAIAPAPVAAAGQSEESKGVSFGGAVKAA